MGKQLSVELLDLRNIIEANGDDNMMRNKIGEFILEKAAREDKEIKSLLEIKLIKTPSGVSANKGNRLSKCCRGHV